MELKTPWLHETLKPDVKKCQGTGKILTQCFDSVLLLVVLKNLVHYVLGLHYVGACYIRAQL